MTVTRTTRSSKTKPSEALTMKADYSGTTGGGNAKFASPFVKGEMNVTAYMPHEQYEALGQPTSLDIAVTNVHHDEAPSA